VIALALALGTEERSRSGSPDGSAGKRGMALSSGDVAKIARRVERLRGLRFRRPVKPRFVTVEEGARILRRQVDTGYPLTRQRRDEEELKLLGLLKPSDDLGKILRATEQEQVLGFYDPTSKRLVVIRSSGDSRAVLEITLSHELVHALEDQRFGFEVHGGLSDDAAVGDSALAEGTATAVMTEYADRYVGIGGLLGASLGAASKTETKLPPFVEQSLLFPYIEGERFVDAFRPANGSWRAVDRILELRRPRSAEQVLHPRKYALDERPVAVRIPPMTGILGKSWRLVDLTSVGEFDLRELFAIVGGSSDPAAAAGWGGGRFALWRKGSFSAGGCRPPCIENDVGLLRLAWDTPGDRVEGERALGRAFTHGLDGRRLAERSGVGLWSSRGGAIGMFGTDRRTTVALAPDASLTARILLGLGGH
jgi:hypothetical protein